jgi:threonine-phosphate decarboxylase
MIPDLPAFLAEAQRLRKNLSAIYGLLVMDTNTHYMLVNIDGSSTHDLKQWLIEHYGILIRDASNFRGLDNHCFRVTTRTPEENDLLVEALKEYVSG